MFYATHGQHLNSDEFFEARAKAQCEKDIKVLEAKKKGILLLKKQADAARDIIEKKGQPTESNIDSFNTKELLALATWKLGRQPRAERKNF